MMYIVIDENIVVSASCPLRGVPHGQREALYYGSLDHNHKNQ
ncbi:MAG: hypothetical protein QNJ68_13455 [Microcoleaceae cyanobacterium MO_207.B10]|nr:hypothetical protein [Microcoleaceae cyanobacterium MO_207.B10]